MMETKKKMYLCGNDFAKSKSFWVRLVPPGGGASHCYDNKMTTF
jgi:hypothetical protein